MKYLKNTKNKEEFFELLDKLFAEIFDRIEKIEKMVKDLTDEWEL